MTLKEVQKEALKLPACEREELVQQLLASLASLGKHENRSEEDPIFRGGSHPVDLDVTEAAVLEGERDPLYNLGKNPASGGDLDGTSELDKYLYDRSRL
jgi:hypothetical protein